MRRAALPALLLLCACCAQPAPAPADPAPAQEVPVAEHEGPDLNPYVLEVLRSYPTDGSYRYYWPKSGGWEGTTQDVIYAGTKLTSGDPEKRSYCCGLTFEVYVKALLRAGGGPVPGVDAAKLHELRLRFFGDSAQVHERRKLVQFGLESLGLGRAVAELSDARAGDFVQFWRHSGSGHSAIFINWIYAKGEIAGFTYWSSQSTTQGIGYNTERIGPDGVKRDEIYLGRARWPLRPG